MTQSDVNVIVLRLNNGIFCNRQTLKEPRLREIEAVQIQYDKSMPDE